MSVLPVDWGMPTQAIAKVPELVQWEYRTLYVRQEQIRDAQGRERPDWVIRFRDGSMIVGLDLILNEEGKHGWELVSTITEVSDAFPTQYGSTVNTSKVITAVLKRPR